MNNKSKKIIIIAIIILIIAIIGVLIMIKKINKDLLSDVIEYEGNYIVNNELEKVSVRSNYYIVKTIVEKYYLNLCNLNKTTEAIEIYEYEGDINQIEAELSKQISTEIELTKKRILNLFDQAYTQEADISTDNLKDKLGDYKDLYVLIKNMYVKDLSEYLKLYFIFGTVVEKENSEIEDFRLMILTDEKNKTYNIYTSEYIDQNKLYERSKDKDFTMDITEIENRKYNTYKYEYINDETYVSDLLNNYKTAIKHIGTDYAYDKLDEEYRAKRFNEKSDYEKYVTENKKEITTALIEYYKVDKYDEYTQYTCMDRKGNYYIFREKANMDYSLILDIYTIDLPEFIEKYEVATTEDKVKLNIEKIVQALNEKDYKYIYNKLVNEFKSNYFKTYEEFEEYAKKTFDVENEVTYNQYTESKNYSTYKITLKGKNKNVTKTIVMKLEEGTDFIMSFNVE